MASVAKSFNICAVVQAGRLQYEAIPFLLSFRYHNPDFKGKLLFMEPVKNKLWKQQTKIPGEFRSFLKANGAEIVPFENEIFGQKYQHGNKIECLKALPEGEPFVFFDTDTIFTGSLDEVPFDFNHPSASSKVENTWPAEEIYGPTLNQTWGALYDKFNLDFDAAQDTQWPKAYWRRYPYYNAGWFYFKNPQRFGRVFTRYAKDTWRNPPPEVMIQQLNPWLDQAVLPLVIHRLGGGKDILPPGLLDGRITTHYRYLPLLYARADDETIAFVEELLAPHKVKKLLKENQAFQKMVYQGKGAEVRALFNRRNLPRKEEPMRRKIKEHKLWIR